MSEAIALSLLEELLTSQQDLVSEINDLTLQIELSDIVEINQSEAAQTAH